MALRKIRNVWYVYFVDIDGTQRTRSLKTTDKAAAEVLHRRFMRELQSLKGELAIMRHFPERFAGQLESIKSVVPVMKRADGEHSRGSIALAAMWDLALTRRQLSGTHGMYWRKFVGKIGVKFADQITPAVALRYLEDNYGSGNGKSFNNAKSALNTVFRCCLVEAGLSASPFEPIINRRVVDVEHHRNLTLEEVERIMAASEVPEYMKIMVMLSRWTAQRLETCARMTPAMFDFEEKVFIIAPGKTKRFKKWVCCPIMPELERFIVPVLAKCADPELPIVSAFGYTSNNAFSKAFTALLQQLGVLDNASGKASFHSLRGTAITWFIENGVPDEVMKLITGHASQAVEDIYARPMANVARFVEAFSTGR